MGKKTTVDLTDIVLPLKDKYQPIYGLKNILSAGLLLFDRIPQHLREPIIGIANGGDEDVGEVWDAAEASDALDAAFVSYRLLSPEEQKWLDDLRADAIAAQRLDTTADHIVADAHRKSAKKKAARKGTASHKSAKSSRSAG